MKILLAAVAVLLVSGTANADSISFRMSFRSDYVDGIGRVTIHQAEGGQLTVFQDPNTCTKNGRLCTRIAVRMDTITPKVIEDRRPLDGPLLLQLVEGVVLEVGSGYNIDETITYVAIVTKNETTTRMPLKVHAFTSIE